MIDDMTTVADVDAERRWREWQARGMDSDRRASWIMHRLLFCAIAIPTVWGVLQFI